MLSFLQIWSHLLKKSIKENLISCAVCSIEEALDSDVQHFLTLFFSIIFYFENCEREAFKHHNFLIKALIINICCYLKYLS